MIDIEELSKTLSKSAVFKQFINQQVRQCIEDRQNKNHSAKDIPLEEITRQIAGQLSQITEIVLEEENSHNYMSLMRNSQEMCSAIQKRIELEFQEKVNALNKKIEELTLQLQERSRNVKNSTASSDSVRLKQERKTITKSILYNSRLVPNAKTKSSITPRQIKQVKFDSSEFESMNKQTMETNDSRSIPSLQDQNCQDPQTIENHPIIKSLLKTVEQINTQTIKTQQSFCSLSEKVDFKIDNSLQGLWNVLGDLNARLAKIQSKLQGIGIETE